MKHIKEQPKQTFKSVVKELYPIVLPFFLVFTGPLVVAIIWRLK